MCIKKEAKREEKHRNRKEFVGVEEMNFEKK